MSKTLNKIELISRFMNNNSIDFHWNYELGKGDFIQLSFVKNINSKLSYKISMETYLYFPKKRVKQICRTVINYFDNCDILNQL